jgi:PAS domain S-box-containing protein
MDMTNGLIKVLLVEDDEIDRRITKRALDRCSLPVKFAIEPASTLSKAAECLAAGEYDVILLDMGLPDSAGIDTVRDVGKLNSHIPIVVLTGLDDEETGLLAIKNGAADYLVKGPSLTDSLVRTILYALERKKAALELQLTEERYRTIFENSAVAITMADEQERLISWNKFTEWLLGMSSADLYLKPVKSLYPEGEWEKVKAQRVKQKGMQHHFETKMAKKNGEVIDVDVSLSVLKDPDGKITNSIGVIRNITDRKKAEEKLKEAMRIKSEFISTVSHELRTPLAIMKEDIAIVLDEAAGKINEKQKHFLQAAERNLNRLVRLINDVLDFQKLDSGRMKFNMQENDINEVIKNVHKTMDSSTKDNGLELNLKLEDNLPKSRFDSDRIIQVLTNLVNNAVRFTEKGSITITTRRMENTIQVSVSDTGCGIEQEDMPRLFHRFEQLATGNDRKTGGTGLGLAISKEIIEGHGGKIWAESQFQKGTTIHFLLPIRERRAKLREKS